MIRLRPAALALALALGLVTLAGCGSRGGETTEKVAANESSAPILENAIAALDEVQTASIGFARIDGPAFNAEGFIDFARGDYELTLTKVESSYGSSVLRAVDGKVWIATPDAPGKFFPVEELASEGQDIMAAIVRDSDVRAFLPKFSGAVGPWKAIGQPRQLDDVEVTVYRAEVDTAAVRDFGQLDGLPDGSGTLDLQVDAQGIARRVTFR